MVLILVSALLFFAASSAPSAPQLGPGTNVISPAPFQVTLNYQNRSCTTTKPCLLQIFRARCKTPTVCPQNWVQIASGSAGATPTQTGTSWVVIDKDPALTPSTKYFYRATNSFQSAPTTYSAYSPQWSGTTGAGVPVAPTVGTGNNVN